MNRIVCPLDSPMSDVWVKEITDKLKSFEIEFTTSEGSYYPLHDTPKPHCLFFDFRDMSDPAHRRLYDSMWECGGSLEGHMLCWPGKSSRIREPEND